MRQKINRDAEILEFMEKFDLSHCAEEISELLFVKDFEDAPHLPWDKVSYWLRLRQRLFSEYEGWFVSDLARLFMAKICYDISRPIENLVLKARAERAYAGNAYWIGCNLLAEHDKRSIKFFELAKGIYKETYKGYSKNNSKHCTFLARAYAMLAMSTLRLEVPERIEDPHYLQQVNRVRDFVENASALTNRTLDRMANDPPERIAKFLSLWQNIGHILEEIQLEAYSKIDHERCLCLETKTSELAQRVRQFEHKTL